MTGTRKNANETLSRGAGKQHWATSEETRTVAEDSTLTNPDRHGRALGRAWGGRLRTYRPKPGGEPRLTAIRKALVRGELALNGFNRWRLLQGTKPATGWTFAEPGTTKEVAQTEIRIAKREADVLRIVVVDESTAREIATRLEMDDERPDLVVAQRDWSRDPSPCPGFGRVLKFARERGLVVHVIAALGSASHPEDALFREARQRWRLDHEPLLRPLPQSSRIERRFGRMVANAGFTPIAQHPVAHYFLDFAVVGQANGFPVRLDIEVDGRHWHEELPGRYRFVDERRDQILKRLGWRPIRFWTDEIEQDAEGSIERIRREAASVTPIARRNTMTEEKP